MVKTLLIRVDCNPVIASGHLMRCLSIAHKAKEKGIESIFLMSDNSSENVVVKNDFTLLNLHSDWRDLSSEIPKIQNLIHQYDSPVLLIDTYSIDRDYTEVLFGKVPLIYLGSKTDNLGKLDMIVNYSSCIDHEFYKNKFPGTRLLLGVEFAPLRKEFQNLPLAEASEVNDVIITTGNTDHPHFITSFLKKAERFITEKKLRCHVVVGRLFNNKEELERMAERNGLINLHYGVTEMSSLMRTCQLAVTANGTTVYELAACGVPAISFAISEEQLASGESLGNQGIVKYCGLYSSPASPALEKVLYHFESMINDHSERRKLVSRAKSFIDGNGCEYIVQEILKL
ncbi:MAG: hypothetical protein K2J48_00645 [Muribaculaceae bacterium]|nr:hypothetical protein [Muribaculaceae bacterium]